MTVTRVAILLVAVAGLTSLALYVTIPQVKQAIAETSVK